MAKRIVDEEMRFDIIINGDNAQKELYGLEKSTRKLTEENKGLLLQKRLLEKQNKQDSAEYQALTRTIKENNKEIKENKSRMAELQKQIGLNGLTMGQLSKESSRLKLLLRNMVPGSADYQRYSADLQKVTARMDELNGKAKQTKMSLSSIADNFNKYAALGATIIATFTGVVLSLQKMIDYNGKLVGAQSDVMKTTGMTRKEVDELTKSFGLFQSRTSRINLLKIAEVGGRLNIPKAEILDFVKVMDKASVALGDSFEGGAEQVADKLGIIKGLFKETKDAGVEEAFESIGSALNDLGADGAATEQNIADFMARVGTLPPNLKPSISVAAALGAAFEESGLKAEIAGNNYGKVISIAARDTAAFATVMRRPKKELEDLINTNPTEFFLQFSESLKDLDATDLAKVLDYLKLNDNEVKMVIGAAAGNVQLFRDKIDLSAKSMKEATSLTEEYNIKNNDLEATLEKIKKKVTGWFSSDGLVAFLASAATWFGKVIGATDDADGSGKRWRNTLAFIAKAIAVITAALLTNVTWMKLTALWTSRNTEATLLYNLGLKARAVAEALSTIKTQAWALAQALVNRNMAGAVQAMRAMTAAMLSTPWGLVLGLVAAVATAFVAFGDSAEHLTRNQKTLADIAKEVASSTKQEVDALNIKLKIARDVSQAEEVRKKALEDIIAMSPEHLEGLTLENIATAEGQKLLDGYTQSLEKAARAKAVAAKLTELYSELLELEKSKIMDNVKWYEQMWNAIKTGGNAPQMALANIETGLANQAEAKKDIQEAIDTLLEEQFESYKASLAVDVKTKNKSNVYVPPGEEDKEADKAKKEHERRMKDLEQQLKEIRELKHQAAEENISLIQDEFEREIALQQENHRKKLEDLKARLISEDEIRQASAKIKSPDSSPQDVAFWTRQKQVWLDKNKALNNLIEIQEQTHYYKMGAIVEKEYARQIKKLEEKYTREKTIRETEFLQTLNAIHSLEKAKEMLRGTMSQKELEEIKNLEQAKKALKEDFDKAELERQVQFLDESIARMQEQVKSINWHGMDLSLLTPEQKDKIEKEIEQAKLLREKMLAAINGEADSQPGADADREARNEEMGRVFNNLNGGADILGFTPEQWEQVYNNLDTLNGKMAAGSMVVSALQNAWKQYNNFLESNENNQLRKFEKSAEAKQRKLKWQLDNGYINQIQYKRGIEKLEADVERKKAEIEYKQAKRKKMMAIVDTIINTATAIMQGYSQLGPIGGTIAAVVIGTLGALQLKTIAEQPLPARGYEEGLYPDYVKREQDGKMFRASYGGKTKSGLVKKPTYFLTGENGPEMVIDSKAYRGLSDETRNALIRELRGIKGFENGYYNDDVRNPRIEVPAAPVANSIGSPIDLPYALSVINRNSDILEKIYEEGVMAWISKDPRNLKKIQDEQDRIKNSKEKARV